MKKCPCCAEDVQDDAVVCARCGGPLVGSAGRPPSGAVPPGEPPLPWYFKKGFVALMLANVGPFALPLIWLRPRTGIGVKIGVSVLVLVITLLLVLTLMWIYKKIMLEVIPLLRDFLCAMSR